MIMERRILLAYRPLSRELNAAAPVLSTNWRCKRKLTGPHRNASSKSTIHRFTSSKLTKTAPRPKAPATLTLEASAATLSAHASKSFKTAESLSTALLQQPGIPSEAEILNVLTAVETAAKDSINSLKPQTFQAAEEDTPASALLSLDSEHNISQSDLTAQKAIDQLSNLAHQIVVHHPVFITSRILQTYVNIQCLLEKPDTFPAVFDLYARKPIPVPNSNPIKYKIPNPARISQAIPTTTAEQAIKCAVNSPQRSLATAIGIINASYRAPAFRRAKIFTRALPPIGVAAAAPLAAWTLATQFSTLQNSMDEQLMTQSAFAGILTYVVAAGTIGLVALTTANDQMQRVTWTLGMPLRERWIREDERAAVDRVALAWGFKQRSRYGEEEGAEWEALRDWIGMRGMVLDKVSLMEGME